LGAGVGFLASAMMAAPALAGADADYFKGKTINYIVATNPGGGYDFYARLVTRHMKRFLPDTKIVVRNMPGAGHILGANRIYISKPNGLTIGTFNTGLIYAQIIGRKGIRFDLTKMSWIGKAAADPRMVVAGAHTPFKSIRDYQTSGEAHKFGAAGIGSSAYSEAIMLGRAFNMNVRMISGYGGHPSQLAILRNEIVGMMGSVSSVRGFIDAGKGRYILQVGGKPVPGVDQAKDLAETEEAKALVRLIASQAEIARLTAGPPNMHPGRLAVLRAAYKNAVESPELRAAAKKAQRPIAPGYGEEVATMVRKAFKQTPGTVALLKEVLAMKAPTIKVESKLLEVLDRGRWIVFNGPDGKKVKSKVSGSRTKLKIAGKKANRKKLKAGMSCKIAFVRGKRNEPKTMDCN
jgi:tripartite-type tricarboxylate transporter receptor subunit TctC